MTFECEVTPLPGRKKEFVAVLSFINNRMQQTHHKALFIFGACGCGKTSTTLRALRAISDKPLNIDCKDKHNNSSIKQSNKSTAAADDDVVNTACKTSAKKISILKETCYAHSVNQKAETKSINRKRRRSQGDECCEINVDDDDTDNCNDTKINVSKSQTKREEMENRNTGKSENYYNNNISNSNSPRSSTDSLNAAAIRKSKRMEEDATFENKNVINIHYVNVSTNCKDKNANILEELESTEDYKTEYPFLFDPAIRGRRRLQGYYVNCADLNAVQLVEAIVSSMKRAFPRADGPTRELMAVITSLKSSQSQLSSSKSLMSCSSSSPSWSHSRFANNIHGNSIKCRTEANVNRSQLANKNRKLSENAKRRQVAFPPFHVLVLDEVELTRLPAKNVLTALSLLSFERASQLALIFISNQRELVHVPAMLLQELPFTAYSIDQLKQIAVQFVHDEFHCNRENTAKSTFTTLANNQNANKSEKENLNKTVISPSVYELVARRTLLNHSGDVRKLACMCKLIVQVANDDSTSCKINRNSKLNSNGEDEYTTRRYIAIIEGNETNTERSNEHCENSEKDDSNGRSSTISNTSSTTTTTSSSYTEAGAVNTNLLDSKMNKESNCNLNKKTEKTLQTSAKSSTLHTNGNLHSGSTCITLARSVQALKESAMENQIHRHIATMPEQILYILSCLVILTLRGQVEQRRAATAIGGVMHSHAHAHARSAYFTKSKLLCSSSHYSETHTISGSGNNKVHESVSLTTRQVHQLYTSFMGERRFPSMNATSVQLAIDNLADLGILTRPVRRGSDCAFCFNGTWPLQSIEDAITLRGEALQKEMAACGLDDSENKFVSALSDLKRLAHITT